MTRQLLPKERVCLRVWLCESRRRIVRGTRVCHRAAEIEMKEKPILWTPTPKQREFLACPAREVLFAGSVGSGKTDAILMAGLSQANNPKHRALILRRTFPMLRDLIGRSHELFLPLGATFNKGTSQWTFPSGAILEFGFLDADEDKFRYMGRQFSMLGWDEITSWPGDSTDAQGRPVNGAYVYMLSRLRAVEESGLRLEVRATCTSGGIGHAFVKSRWNIPNDGSASEVIDEATGFRRVFIPARISDNPYLAGTEYERQLRALPEASRKALLLGRWDVYEGAVFSEWDPKVHVCAPFPVPAEWEMWRGGDDGYASPAAVLWFAKDDIHDRVYVIAELYASGMTPEVMAREVLSIDKTIPRNVGNGQIIENGSTLLGTIDSASFADTGFGGRADMMNRLGCNWRPALKDFNSRLAGKNAIRQRLAMKSDGLPGLIVFSTCRNLIRTLPELCYDKTRPEDVDSDGEDHLYDAARYGLSYKPLRCGRGRVHF